MAIACCCSGESVTAAAVLATGRTAHWLHPAAATSNNAGSQIAQRESGRPTGGRIEHGDESCRESRCETDAERARAQSGGQERAKTEQATTSDKMLRWSASDVAETGSGWQSATRSCGTMVVATSPGDSLDAGHHADALQLGQTARDLRIAAVKPADVVAVPALRLVRLPAESASSSRSESRKLAASQTMASTLLELGDRIEHLHGRADGASTWCRRSRRCT